jgi:hypothetical protein
MGKKPTDKKQETSSGAPLAPSICPVSSCKKKPWRFSFCSEHFSEYKFGLIKKTGDRVPDYDKKLKHYEEYQESQKVRKVA